MKLQGDITINGRNYGKGDEVPWYMVYPFFLIHMLAFGGTSFYMAYYGKNGDGVQLDFLYLWGGFAIIIYVVFYTALFGRDEVKWLFINAALGLLGICSQIGWLLSFFGRRFSDYPWYVHVIPFLYFVLYTFLLRHAVLDIVSARENANRKTIAERWYIVASIVMYAASYFLERR